MKPAMLREAERLLHSCAEAEDAVQDVFEVLWRNRVRIREKDNPEGLCIRAVKNRCLELLRQKTYEDLQEWMLVDDGTVQEAVEIRESQWAMLNEAIAALPQRQRMLVQKKYLEGKSIREISGETGLSQTNITTILSRASRHLKRNLNLEKYPRFRKLKNGRQ